MQTEALIQTNAKSIWQSQQTSYELTETLLLLSKITGLSGYNRLTINVAYIRTRNGSTNTSVARSKRCGVAPAPDCLPPM